MQQVFLFFVRQQTSLRIHAILQSLPVDCQVSPWRSEKDKMVPKPQATVSNPDIDRILILYMPQRLKQKGSEVTGCMFEPRPRRFFLHFIYQKLYENLPIIEKFLDFRSKIFS